MAKLPTTTLHLRQRLVGIAERDVGKLEESRNQADWIDKYWLATSYPDGGRDRAPYCAAAVCYWVNEWLRDPDVSAALNLTTARGDLWQWRCRSAAAFDWIKWGRERGLTVFDDNPRHVLRTGDIMVFDMSHIGIVTGDSGGLVYTIEANTGAKGTRDGEGCFRKSRRRAEARAFIRLLN